MAYHIIASGGAYLGINTSPDEISCVTRFRQEMAVKQMVHHFWFNSKATDHSFTVNVTTLLYHYFETNRTCTGINGLAMALSDIGVVT